eukprot:gb/GECG01008140.1/.p1 GENE.gb/GECG01008140.1/~~gb/GECG01008140.1/.p1  ORF type:complete len:137 (+),score=7.42 gb/GECG01008140.1/:1-411(+)
MQLWRFEAPPKFHGNFAIAYNGTVQITMTSGDGLFKEQYTNALPQLVRIECAACDGARGLALAVFANGTNSFGGLSTKFEIPLHEDYWLVDSGSPILPWKRPTTMLCPLRLRCLLSDGQASLILPFSGISHSGWKV